MYRVYVVWANQTVTDKVFTASPVEAETLFRNLMQRREYWCRKCAAVLSQNSQQLEYRRFDTILPADPGLREKAKQGQFIPHVPLYLYPEERYIADEFEPDSYVLCYLDRTKLGALILDDQTAIRVSWND